MFGDLKGVLQSPQLFMLNRGIFNSCREIFRILEPDGVDALTPSTKKAAAGALRFPLSLSCLLLLVLAVCLPVSGSFVTCFHVAVLVNAVPTAWFPILLDLLVLVPTPDPEVWCGENSSGGSCGSMLIAVVLALNKLKLHMS